MRGIDVSSHDGWPYHAATEAAYGKSDFLIAKCTEGTRYVNPNFAKAMSRALADGKLMGMYHYASGGSPSLEADYFTANAGAWKGRAIPVLDFESYGNARATDPHWARQFCERVHTKWGIWPMVYTYASMLAKVASCHPECALWVAGYPTDTASWTVPDFRYDIAPWEEYAVWQFTSGRETCDRNTSPLTKAQWTALAAGEAAPRAASKSKADGPKAYTVSAYPTLNVRRRRTVNSPVVGTVKYGTVLKLENLKENSKGNTWARIASGAHAGGFVAVVFGGKKMCIRKK